MITVLLIDDDEDEFILFSEALYRLGRSLNCVHANSAKSALELLEKFCPLYIYVDIHMPETTGIECIELIRGQEGHQRTPVILYSATVSTLQWGKAKAVGANGHLKKTGSLATLVDEMLAFFLRYNMSLFS